MSALESEGGQYSEGLREMLPGSEKLDRPHSRMMEWDEKEKRNDPKGREEKEQNP